jgi:hypothetical protein
VVLGLLLVLVLYYGIINKSRVTTTPRSK